jgi:hypothetical protein
MILLLTGRQIEEFRNYLDDNHEQLERNALERRVVSKDVGRSPSLLRGTTTPASREELESYIPSRDVTDRLVNRFFSFYGSLRRMYNYTLLTVH